MAYAFDIEPTNPRGDVDEEGFADEEDDDALPKGMVPLADMLNADADRNNARLFYEAQYLEMKALKPISAGEEIFNDYGPLPRSDLLRRYGYITDNYTQYDVAEVSMELVTEFATAAGVLHQERMEYLDEQGVIDTGYDIATSDPFTLQESFSPELIVLVETLCLTPDEFDRLKNKGKLPKAGKITAKGAELLHKIVQDRLDQYATTLDEDERAVNGTLANEADPKQHRYAMAKAVRIGEKQILRCAREALAELFAKESNMSKRQRPVDEEGDVDMGGTGKKQKA